MVNGNLFCLRELCAKLIPFNFVIQTVEVQSLGKIRKDRSVVLGSYITIVGCFIVSRYKKPDSIIGSYKFLKT